MRPRKPSRNSPGQSIVSLDPATAELKRRQKILQVQQDIAASTAQPSPGTYAGGAPPTPANLGLAPDVLTPTQKHAADAAFGGGVGALTHGITPTPLPAAPVHRKVKVTIHPDGTITAQHGPAASTPGNDASTDPAIVTARAPATTPAGVISHSVHKADGTILDGGVNPKPKVKIKPRATATSTGGTAAPLTDSQLVSNQLAQIYAPIIAELQSVYGDRQKNVNTYTRELADLFGQYAPQSNAAYGDAITAQSAVDAALTGALHGDAAGATSDLAGKLAGITNPEYAAKLSGGLANDYSGAGTTMAATGSNTLGQLLGEKAHAGDFGAKLPGIAGLYGLQATKGVSKDLQTELRGLASQEAQQIPTLTSSLQDQRIKREQLQFEQNLASKEYGLKANADKRAQQQIDNETATTLSNLYGTDGNGNLTLAGRRVAAQEAAAKKKQTGLTASQRTSLLAKADKRADDLYYGVEPKMYQGQPVAGTGVPPVEYPQALKRLVAMGLTVAQAKKILDARYQPGEGGRPVFTPAQDAANATLFPDPFAGLLPGH